MKDNVDLDVLAIKLRVNQVLKQRLVTAIILFSLLLWGILALSSGTFAVVLGVFIAIGAWEWTRMMEIENGVLRVGYVVLVIVSLQGGWWLLQHAQGLYYLVIIGAVIAWIMAIYAVKTFPNHSALYSKKLVKSLIGILLLLPTWLAIIGLHISPRFGPNYVVYLILLTSVADTGAYFGGKRWGKNKLAPALSPGKTWEGVGSALVATMLFSVVGALLLDVGPGQRVPIITFILISIVVVIFSIIGDLIESLFKRLAKLKDSGSILPGHGGILDRIDSLTAAAPMFLLGLWLFLDFELGVNTL